VHEWALAEAVVNKAAEVAREAGLARVREVVVGLGELQAVDREAFEFGLTSYRREVPALADATFSFEVDPARCTCRTCGHAWLLGDSLAAMDAPDRESVHLVPEMVTLFVACAACGSPDFTVTGGRGVSLLAVES
jgi:Zn finger protein HypA/HybF involved in hydrogenase expression